MTRQGNSSNIEVEYEQRRTLVYMREHYINKVHKDSLAEELSIEEGDVLLKINDTEIEDIFDYQFLMEDTYVEILIRKKNGEEWLLEVDKDEDEDLGVEFENGLMDEYKSCRNKCIFCFIDQMPKGMRDTLYFKDDDSRLSFLQGNYVTLTNLSDKDIDRIIRYNLGPINISVQTMNKELRCMMLNNRFAGEALDKMKRLYDGGITMNGQIVLCKGVNDGKELEYSIRELERYIPLLQSVSVVPVGLTKYREGLYPLSSFDKKDAEEVINIIEDAQKRIFEKHGIHFIHASDEFYILAERKLPEGERYDGYLQLENGVGMLTLLKDEVEEYLDEVKDKLINGEYKEREISLATGLLAYPVIFELAEEIRKYARNIKINVYPVRNDFFGEKITVSGLITGKDLISQLRGKSLGEALYLPCNMLRFDEDVFLDDVKLAEASDALQVKTFIVKSSGRDFVNSIVFEDSNE